MFRVSPAFPERVGWYELLAPIGAGGMATVYLGLAERAGGFQRQVAVKMIHGTTEADPLLAADLMKEAKLVARIRHPNVVAVHDVGEDPLGLFLVMDYIEGDNLAGLRRAAKRLGRRIPETIALKIVTEALAGLHAAHELTDRNGQSLLVVHRDFSPQNILVGTDGISRLTDFGIAKVAYTGGHTRTGRIKGKIAYMAPEQARGVKVDKRCDVWAAGVVTWEALTGERLFDTEDEIGALLRIVNEDPTRLSSLRPDLPRELDEALAWALCRDLARRCPTADALRRRLLAAHPIADTSEVADFVKEIVGPKLAERERKITEIRRLRGKLGELATLPMEALSSPRHGVDVTDTAVATDRTSGPTDSTLTRVQENTDGAPIAWKAEERPSQTTESKAAASTISVSQSLQNGVSWALHDRRRAAIIGIAGGMALAVGGVSALVVTSKKSESAVTATASAAAVPPPRVLEPIAAPPPATAEANPAPSEPAFAVRANAAIESLKIDGKKVVMAGPSSEVALEEHPAAGASIEAIASDGRKAKGSVPADAKLVTLEFAPRSVAFGRKGSKPTLGTPAKKPGLPLADSPYAKKK